MFLSLRSLSGFNKRFQIKLQSVAQVNIGLLLQDSLLNLHLKLKNLGAKLQNYKIY